MRKRHDFIINTVSLFHEGCFYETYDDDARVLSHLTNYRIKERRDRSLRCGFPEGTLEKVCDVLEENGISYVVSEKGAVAHRRGFENNEYVNALRGFDEARVEKYGH